MGLNEAIPLQEVLKKSTPARLLEKTGYIASWAKIFAMNSTC